MVARARRILSELDALVSDVAACKDEVAGTVRVGMIGTTARWLVPGLMDMARKRHPKLRLVVVEGNTTGLEPQLASGQLDLAVLHLPVSGRDLVTRLLFEEDLMLVVPQGHAMVDPGRPLGLEDLADMELILPAPGYGLPRRARRRHPAARDHPPAGGRDRRAPAHRLAHLRGLRTGHPAGHRHPLDPPCPVPPGLHRRAAPSPGRRGPAQPRAAVGPDPRLRRAPRRGGGGARRPTRRRPRRGLNGHDHPGHGGPLGHRPMSPTYPPGTRGSRHMRQMGGLPTLEWSSSTTSKPNRA